MFGVIWSDYTITAVYRTMLGISEALVARIGFTNCPTAAPNGLARLARAVADTRPLEVNHKSL